MIQQTYLDDRYTHETEENLAVFLVIFCHVYRALGVAFDVLRLAGVFGFLHVRLSLLFRGLTLRQLPAV